MTSRSSITTDEPYRLYRKTACIHPGEILGEDFLKPMRISQYRLAVSIGVPPRRINEIIHGKRGISADTALRLGMFFTMSADFWMNLQQTYEIAAAAKALGARLEREVTPWEEQQRAAKKSAAKAAARKGAPPKQLRVRKAS